MTTEKRCHWALVLTPLDRLAEVPIYGKVLSAIIGVMALMYQDLLAGILLLLVCSGAIDYFLGRHAARRAGVYDPQLAQAGALTKVSAILMVCLIRGFEFWATQNHVPGLGVTDGIVSSTLATGLFIMDLESIEHHRILLHARPIPGFSQVIAWLRALERRMLPEPPASPPTPEQHRP